MATTLDINTDYTIFDNTESVDVLLKRNPTVSVTVASGLRAPMDRQLKSMQNAHLTRDFAMWFIPDALLNPASNGREPKERDTIEDASDTWTIMKVLEIRLGNSLSGWNCSCIKQVT